MENKKRFRGAMFGFKKQDVNNYIMSINGELGGRIQELEEEHLALEAQKSDLLDEISRLSNENITLQAQSGLSSEQERELQSQIDSLRARLNGAAAESDNLRAQMSSIIAERDNLAANSSSATQEYTALKERVVLLEAERVYIADAILTARHEAERVIAEAHTEANQVYAEMERDVQMLKERMQLENERIEALRNSAQQAIAQYMDNLDKIQI